MYLKHDKIMKRIKDFFLQIGSVYFREFRIVRKDAGLLLFFLFLPLIYPIIYSLIYNPELVRDVELVVVDHDRTSKSRELVRNIDATQWVWVKGYASELGEARRAIHSHKCYGILEIPEGFGRKIGRGEQANAVLYSDMSLMLRYKSFLMAMTDVSLAMGAELQEARINQSVPLAETISNGDPLPINYIPMGNIESGFDSFVMPGVLVLILHQCIILVSGLSGGAKHEDPRMVRYNPVNEAKSVAATMTGQMLCFFTVLILPVLFMLHFVPMIFSFPMEGKLWQILLFIFPMMVACLGLGYTLQVFMKERESVFVIWVVTSVAFLFLSGLTWPRYAIPEGWRWLSYITPATWGVEGFIQMNTNGATLAQVRTEYVNLWILSVAYSLAGYCVNRWIMRPKVNRLQQGYAAEMRSDVENVQR